MIAALPAEAGRRFRAALGPAGCLVGEDIPVRNHRDASQLPGLRPLAVLRPADTAEVAEAMRICAAFDLAVTVQGGMTGLSGGATPTPGSVGFSLERMNRIEALDAEAGTLLAGSGTPLSVVQDAAMAAEMLYPVDLNARASCTIGGTVATNAGGNRVIRYGMTRQSVLGLEVVLADGAILSDLRGLPKNNAGFDLKQLFVGSEGQLGIVTRVLSRLLPRPVTTGCAIAGFRDFPALRACLRAARLELGGTLSAFEAMWPDYWDRITSGALANRRSPLAGRHGLYALIEYQGADEDTDAARFGNWLARMFDAGIAEDAAVARSAADTAAFWALREAAAQVARITGPCLGFDIGVAPSRIGDYVEACRAALSGNVPGVTPMFFGHAGDGNLRVMVASPPGFDAALIHACDAVLYRLVAEFEGTVTAEHGLGQLKRNWLGVVRGPNEIATMRALKAALDPRERLNPGKVFPETRLAP